MVGTTLGHYRIIRLVGKGGMGEVYAAEDLTLGRTVAVKVLPPGVQSRPEDLDRFAREARSVAALNHRAIVTLHSFEQAGGTHFITMELVDGQPLSAGLPPHGLRFDDVLRMGIELADAVAAAHDRGIIHRDLKPANVLVRTDGQLKILDFGLAKLHDAQPATAELPTQVLTGEGRIVGTVAYMSPEQAEGRPVDHRTDIFSLGIVLYELATGRRPFQGDTSMSVLSAVIKDQPVPASEINPSVPAAFARVLKRCLQKDPERRFQTAKDLRNELQAIREELASGELIAPAVTAPPVAARTGSTRWPIYAAGAAVVAAVVLAMMIWPQRPTDDGPVVLQHVRLTSASGPEAGPDLSPDGTWFVYVSAAAGNLDIYLQSVGGQTAINLTKDSPAADMEPAFSPDGERIAFRSLRDGGGLYVMGRTGDAPRRVSPAGRNPAWSPDGTALVFSTVTTELPTSRTGRGVLRIVRLDTGEVTDLTTRDGLHPAWSPDGRFIAFWGLDEEAGGSVSSRRDIWVVPASGGVPWRLTDDQHVDWCPMWAPAGDAIYFASNRGGSMNLWRIPVDPSTGHPAGDPQPVTTPSGYVGLARLARNGTTIVYEARESRSNLFRSGFDPVRRVIDPPEPITTGSRHFRSVDPSPDGQRLVFATGYLQQEDLFISKADGSELRQLTTDAHNDRWPEWSPQGDRIVFYSDRSGHYETWVTTPAGQLTRLTDAPDFSLIYPRWSPTGKWMTISDPGRGAVLIFDPNQPWKDQTPKQLPPIPGRSTSFTGRPFWSADETQLAGTVANQIYIYDITARQYREVPNARGTLGGWLADHGLLVSGPGVALIDPVTGVRQPVTLPSRTMLASPDVDFAARDLRLSRDGKTLFSTFVINDADIWMVTLGKK